MTRHTLQPLLELKNVSKIFRSIQVLEKVNFAIYPGEIVALLGDNGAGKSTLIKMIAGFHQPTEGEMLWEGQPLQFNSQNGPHVARQLGIETVYQDLGLVNSLSITRNFFLGRELTKKMFGCRILARKEMAQIASIKLKEMGIARDLSPHDLVEKLSGGERQAIAISRARYFGAKLLILDEPTSALSLRQTQKVLSYILESARSGLAVIFITHTLAHIESVVDRIVVLYRGQKAGDYLPSQVTQHQIGNLITQGGLN